MKKKYENDIMDIDRLKVKYEAFTMNTNSTLGSNGYINPTSSMYIMTDVLDQMDARDLLTIAEVRIVSGTTNRPTINSTLLENPDMAKRLWLYFTNADNITVERCSYDSKGNMNVDHIPLTGIDNVSLKVGDRFYYPGSKSKANTEKILVYNDLYCEVLRMDTDIVDVWKFIIRRARQVY